MKEVLKMIFLNGDAILASSISKSRKALRPSIDCDVMRFFIDLAIFTSLIHDIESWGNGVVTHTSVLKLGCCWLPLSAGWKTDTPNGFALTSRSCVNSGEVNCPASMVSVMSDATTVGTSSMSVVKLFFLEGKVIGVHSLEISIRSFGS